VKVEHVEQKSTSKIQIEIVYHIYNQRFKKYLDYHWIQQSIVWNVTSRRFKIVRFQLSHINRSYIFLFIMCTSIEDVYLNWDDFAKFYDLINSNITLLEHVITKFPYLLHFLDSWCLQGKERHMIN
jgi:hypothetical protein